MKVNRRESIGMIAALAAFPAANNKFADSKSKLELEIETIEWDFNEAVGDTIREKFKTLISLVNKLCPDGGLIITDCALSAIFETCDREFKPTKNSICCGIVQNKYHLHKTTSLKFYNKIMLVSDDYDSIKYIEVKNWI